MVKHPALSAHSTICNLLALCTIFVASKLSLQAGVVIAKYHDDIGVTNNM